MAILLPLAPSIQMGEFTVTVELSTQITRVVQELTINVAPEGSLVHRHTSVLLDLRARANVLRFMNIIVDETNIIPYEVYRRYVSGSARARLTISGDVVGPIFPAGEPVMLRSMFSNSNHGNFGRGCANKVFNLGVNTWQLHYLRLTNQLTDNWDTAKGVFEKMNYFYMTVLKSLEGTGGLKEFGKRQGSVWMTAWGLRVFAHTAFQEWEDYIYIDPRVMETCASWLLNFQSDDGHFVENYDKYRNWTRLDSTVALTAHVLIGLEEISPHLSGTPKAHVAAGKQRSVAYLERHLAAMGGNSSASYDLAITALALTLSGSSVADLAYAMLMKLKRKSDGMIYWSDRKISPNRVRYEFNRPFLEAKDYQESDGEAVEATAYALRTMFLIEGGGLSEKRSQVVRWLNTMRHGDGGFISAPNTLAALHALVLFSYHSRIKGITDMTVEVDFPDSNLTYSHHINQGNVLDIVSIEPENVWGHVNLFARGSGQAVVSLDLSFGVDIERFKDRPPHEFYNLTVTEFFHGRNKSEVTIEACFSWNAGDAYPADRSGMTMLAVEIPSGYEFEWTEAYKVMATLPSLLVNFDKKPGKTLWYLDHVPAEETCFQHTVRRYLPVANLTRTRQAVIFEPFRPERFFVRTFNATSLYVLSVCEVCGSYQCPYCPFYSGVALPPTLSYVLSLTVIVCAIFIQKTHL